MPLVDRSIAGAVFLQESTNIRNCLRKCKDNFVLPKKVPYFAKIFLSILQTGGGKTAKIPRRRGGENGAGTDQKRKRRFEWQKIT
jgi:hypothetical protein